MNDRPQGADQPGSPGGVVPDGAKGRLTLRIYGEDYPLKSSADEEHLKALGMHVDAVMRRVAVHHAKLGTGRVAVLAALQIADELFRLRQEHETLTSIFEDEWAKRQGKD